MQDSPDNDASPAKPDTDEGNEEYDLDEPLSDNKMGSGMQLDLEPPSDNKPKSESDDDKGVLQLEDELI